MKTEKLNCWDSDELAIITAKYSFPEGFSLKDRLEAFNEAEKLLGGYMPEDFILKVTYQLFFGKEGRKVRSIIRTKIKS